MIYIVGVGLNLFLLLLLISKKNKSFADKVLVAWLFVVGCHLSLYVLSFQPITIKNIHQMGLSIPFPFLHGPFLYLYTAAVTNQVPGKKWLWVHFIPAVLIVLLGIPFFISSAEYKMQVLGNNGKDYALFLKIAAWCMKLSGVLYVVVSFLLLRKHKKNIGKLFSYEEKISLNWLRYFIYASLVVWAIIIFVQKDSFIFGAVAIFVFFLGYFGIRQVGVFGQKEISLIQSAALNEPIVFEEQKMMQQKEETIEKVVNKQSTDKDINKNQEETPVKETISLRQKYSNSGLSEKMAIEIHVKLGKLMASEKIFTEPELSLSMLSGKLNVHPNYVSQVINDKEGKSFFDYINSLRVEEFKSLASIPEKRQFTIMSLAYDCGFNSKSSFNKNFKKATGQSPSDYISSLSNKV